MTGASRGSVMKGPDLFADHDYRPYVRLSDDSHPFGDEEALYVAVTTTPRSVAVSLTESDFAAGSLPKDSYANPWTVVPIRHADIQAKEGQLTRRKTNEIAREAANYLGIE